MAVHPTKVPSVPVQFRMDMIRRATTAFPNVRVTQFSGLLVRYAMAEGAQVIIRGLRDTEDFVYEQRMSQLNRGMESAVETLFLMSSPQVTHISASHVREIAAWGGDIGPLVPPEIAAEIAQTYKR